jgi:[amino-group carrier protein]-gamma-(L-lysyl/L-ornithyl)-L-glutamate aminotransferase
MNSDKISSIDEIIEQEKTHGPFLYGIRNTVFTHGKGSLLYTNDNQEYIDFISGHGVGNVGHSHPKVVKAIQDQAAKLVVLHSSFPHEERAKLFKKITEITPAPLTNTFLSNSGAESVEMAIKLSIVAHRNIKEPHIIAMKRSFHGRTMGALSVTFGPAYRKAFQGFMGNKVSFVSFGNIEAVKEAINENTVAIITEIIQGEGGIYPAPAEFPKELRELCDEKNITLIFDEVQSGVGRTGKMFAFEHYDVVPDVVCMAKSLAGGVPIGATVAREEIYKAFKKGEMASTFGGNPLSCAAANATIDVILNENLLEKAASLGNLFEKTVEEWKSEEKIASLIREQRGLGLMRGIQLKSKAGLYLKACYENKLLLLNAGMTVIRALPPLVTTEKQMIKALDILKDTLLTI